MKPIAFAGLALAALLAASPISAQTPQPAPDTGAKPAPGGMHSMMRDKMMKPGGMREGHHRRNCFDAAWQSDEWKRCESMMGGGRKPPG